MATEMTKMDIGVESFKSDSENEQACFGTGRFFLAADHMESCEYDSDRDTGIPSEMSDETDFYFHHECYDSDTDSNSLRLKEEYITKLHKLYEDMTD
jgi:hypothetical protein